MTWMVRIQRIDFLSHCRPATLVSTATGKETRVKPAVAASASFTGAFALGTLAAAVPTFTLLGGPRARSPMGDDDGVADRRGITLVIHYSLLRAPEFGYQPRTADDRVGHFLSASKDFASTDVDSNFVRLVNRWRLEKANPQAKLSPPRKQIVWYVEDTVPIEYRPYVEEGIREWNKAFEKIGFRDAIAVRWEEPGRDDFDPEDSNYCTFRWITADVGYDTCPALFTPSYAEIDMTECDSQNWCQLALAQPRTRSRKRSGIA